MFESVLCVQIQSLADLLVEQLGLPGRIVVSHPGWLDQLVADRRLQRAEDPALAPVTITWMAAYALEALLPVDRRPDLLPLLAMMADEHRAGLEGEEHEHHRRCLAQVLEIQADPRLLGARAREDFEMDEGSGRLGALVGSWLDEAIASGDDQSARRIGATFWRMWGHPERAASISTMRARDLDRLRLYLRASDYLDDGLGTSVSCLRRIGDLREAELDRLCLNRLAGDRHARAMAEAPGLAMSMTQLGVAKTEADWEQLITHMIRYPELFRASSPGAPEGDCLSVKVSPAALDRVRRRFAGHRLDGKLLLITEPASEQEAAPLSLCLAYRMEGHHGGRAHALQAVCEIGTAGRDDDLEDALVPHLPDADERAAVLASRVDLTRRLECRDRGPLRCADPVSSLPDFRIEDTCSHRHATMEPLADMSGLRVHCPSCRRPQMAVVPAHRLPNDPSHPHYDLRSRALDSPRALAAYIRGERAAALILGLTPPGEELEDQEALRFLIRRDGISSQSSADHLASAAAPAPKRREISVSELIRAGRRTLRTA
ncbi:hypothetical protein [Miltoncostaea oceani]|uniref:hypothetical protein n=1 Tax=Miltoncostaea oceani TaxID=2843216 RepID=UPI001C3E7FA1|nr:hypothetical protein [Miltoncostaea oceani]